MRAVHRHARQRRRRELLRQQQRRLPAWVPIAFTLGFLSAFGLLAGGTAVAVRQYETYTKDLKNPARILARDQGPAIIYDRDGNQLYEFEDKETGLREPVPLDAISPWLVKATIATEDPDFYSNNGINERGLARAVCEYVQICPTHSAQTTGGSGITQQLVKLLFEPPALRAERSVSRKVHEAAMAVELTKRYNKDQILEWYLNTIDYANRANGIGAAAHIYFNKKAADLDLAESALLAGIPASPADYDPIAHFTRAKDRQAQVLDLMVKHGQITQEEADQARAEPLDLKEQTTVIREPHWVTYMTDYLRNHCKELVPDCKSGDDALYHMGLRIVTTLDSELTDQATAIVDKDVAAMEKANCECHNGAVMIIDNNTGQVLSMVGSRDYYRKDIDGKNNNTLAQYQPGSALKPLVYLSAFLKGWSPGTTIVDGPRCFPDRPGRPFCPSGPTRNWNGPVPVRTALGSSLNSPAVQTASFATVPFVVDEAHKMGITTMPDPSQYGPSIATGGSSVTLFDMTYMYSTFANNGEMRGLKLADPKPGYRKLDPVAVLKITDRTGKLLYQFQQPDRDQVVPAPYAYEITSILSDDRAKRLIYSPHLFDMRDGRPIAAKTGTQQGETINGVRATWNFGYVPDITVGVWVGNSDGSFVNPNLLSATSSLNVWKDVMQYAIDKYHIEPKNFVVPSGIAKGVPVPPGSRLTGCGIQPDIYVVGQPVTGPPPPSGGKGCQIAGPGSSAIRQATLSAGREQGEETSVPEVTPPPPFIAATPTEAPTLVPVATPAQPEPVATDTRETPQPQDLPLQPTPPPSSQAPATATAVAQPQSQPAPQQVPPLPPPTTPPLRCPPGLQLPTPVRAQICGLP